MKKYIVIISILVISILSYANIEKYYIGKIEVSQEEYMAVDSTLIRESEVWSSADTTTYIITPGIYARIDSTIQPGKIIITKKSDMEIALIDSIMSAHYREEASKIKVGNKLPTFVLDKYIISNDSTLSYNDALKGRVLLLKFWATWCAPCIEELKPTHLKSIINEFFDDETFIFIPISVNHNKKEIDDFFNTSIGKELEWIKSEMVWDKNGEFAKMLSAGGIPLTILVDKNGIVRLNESAAFFKEKDLMRLKTEIIKLLNQTFESNI